MHAVAFSPERLRTLRGQAGYTRQDLAERCGLSPGAIKDWELGRHVPLAPALGHLAAALRCSVDDFYEVPDAA